MGMKKSIPIIRVRELEAFIPRFGREREFLLTPDSPFIKIKIDQVNHSFGGEEIICAQVFDIYLHVIVWIVKLITEYTD